MSYHLRIHKSRNLRKYQQAAMPGEIPQKAQTAHKKEVQTAHKKEAQTAHKKRPESTWLSGPFEDLYSMSSLAVACRGHAASLLSRSGQLTTVSP